MSRSINTYWIEPMCCMVPLSARYRHGFRFHVSFNLKLKRFKDFMSQLFFLSRVFLVLYIAFILNPNWIKFPINVFLLGLGYFSPEMILTVGDGDIFTGVLTMNNAAGAAGQAAGAAGHGAAPAGPGLNVFDDAVVYVVRFMGT